MSLSPPTGLYAEETIKNPAALFPAGTAAKPGAQNEHSVADLECCVMCCLQAWSITYVSWLTFVFLIWSCMIWMVRDRRRYAMLSSPFMVAYGNLLIVLQYIWSFETMEPVSGLFVEKKNPFHSLSSKVWIQQWRDTQSQSLCNNYHAFCFL